MAKVLSLLAFLIGSALLVWKGRVGLLDLEESGASQYLPQTSWAVCGLAYLFLPHILADWSRVPRVKWIGLLRGILLFLAGVLLFMALKETIRAQEAHRVAVLELIRNRPVVSGSIWVEPSIAKPLFFSAVASLIGSSFFGVLSTCFVSRVERRPSGRGVILAGWIVGFILLAAVLAFIAAVDYAIQPRGSLPLLTISLEWSLEAFYWSQACCGAWLAVLGILIFGFRLKSARTSNPLVA